MKDGTLLPTSQKQNGILWIIVQQQIIWLRLNSRGWLNEVVRWGRSWEVEQGIGIVFPRKPHSSCPREYSRGPGDLRSLPGFATNELGHSKSTPPSESQFTPVSDDYIVGLDEIFPKCELTPPTGWKRCIKYPEFQGGKDICRPNLFSPFDYLTQKTSLVMDVSASL